MAVQADFWSSAIADFGLVAKLGRQSAGHLSFIGVSG